MLRAPSSIISFEVAIALAPAPVNTIFTSLSFLFTILSALSSAARVTTAVPCWSSWKTGMSSSACNRSSISKQRGAAMSSRLMPPKTGAIAFTVRTISSTFLVSSAIGKASTPANDLKMRHLPSMTGRAAAGPISPRPSTAEPSVTTATVCCLIVRL